MKILLVDDLAANLTLLKIVLESRKFEVRCAHNGQEALAMALDEPPGLVISDILMPILDGYALCRAWMEDPRLRGIPFIFYTATYQSDEDEVFARSLGALAFLRKPMEPEAFLEQVLWIIQSTLERPALPPGPAPAGEETYLKLYNERLVQKLDQRSQQLSRRVDELVQVESSLRLKSAALEVVANGILITDRQGRIEWVNPAFTAITGFDGAEVLGRTPRVLDSGSHDADFFRKLWETLLAGRVWRGELVNRRRNGELQTVLAAITPMCGEDGSPSHFIEIMEDISLQKRMELEFRQSQKMEAVGRLAGGVAHDFNNMLNVILINAELTLMGTALSAADRARVLEIQEAAERSAVLTRQLLAFSRKQVAHPRRLNLDAAVAENLKMLQRMIEGDIELAIRPTPGLGQVFIDPSQVSQILTNLVINARDALSAAGRISIETANVTLDPASAGVRADLAPGSYVRLTVSDTGRGMDAATLEHVFEPFFTTKAEGQGTGLGLATVYGIIKQNQGAITVYSHPGVGTSFHLYLPECRDQETAEAPEAAAPVAGGCETVLVVEDEKALLSAMELALAGKGYRVLAAASPLDALLLVQQHAGPIHMLVTDVVMPGLNGKELGARIGRDRPGLRVLYLSGYTGDILARRGLITENIRFMQKPFRLLDLTRQVREALDAPTEAGGGRNPG